MRKLLMLCMFVMGCWMAVHAQSGQTETVYLKNGSIIKGKVVEVNPNKEIRVQTSDGSLVVYRMDEVDKVIKNDGHNESGGINNSKSFKFPVDASAYNLSGIRGIVEFAYTMGEFDAPELSLSLGYQFNPYFFLGAGVSGQYLSNPEKAGIPIFVDMRGTLFLGTVSPYFDFKMGYEILPDFGYYDIKGGLYCSPVVGVKVMTTSRQAVTIGIGASILKPKNMKDTGFAIKLGYEF